MKILGLDELACKSKEGENGAEDRMQNFDLPIKVPEVISLSALWPNEQICTENT